MQGRVVWPGFSDSPAPRHVAHVGRNEPCPCGSGKKYKDCHQKDGEAFLERLARAEDKERARARRGLAPSEAHVPDPWYRRLFRGRR